MSVVSRIPLIATTISSQYTVQFPAATPANTTLVMQTIQTPQNSIAFIVSIKNLSANANTMLPQLRVNGTLLPDSQFTINNQTQYAKEDETIPIHQIVRGQSTIVLQCTNLALIGGAAVDAYAEILWWYIDWKTFENFQDDPEILPFYKMIKDPRINKQFVI